MLSFFALSVNGYSYLYNSEDCEVPMDNLILPYSHYPVIPLNKFGCENDYDINHIDISADRNTYNSDTYDVIQVPDNYFDSVNKFDDINLSPSKFNKPTLHNSYFNHDSYDYYNKQINQQLKLVCYPM
jgi:hypothetical protein